MGVWPGRGPFRHLPPWKRPGWHRGWRCCSRWLAFSGELEVLEEYRLELEKVVEEARRELERVRRRLEELKGEK